MWLAILAIVFWIVPFALVSAHALIHKHDGRSALIWIYAGFALPVIGPFSYLVIGINRIHRRTQRRLGDRARPFRRAEEARVAEEDAALRDAIGPLDDLHTVATAITRFPLLPGNFIEPLFGGEQTYPAMLNAIASATRSITLASYIFDWDEVGRRFVDALAAASRRGVRVHVLLDGIGAAGLWTRMGRSLAQAGAEVAPFFPMTFPFGRFRVNMRNHRKILVVDGRIGFTGGMNISRRHLLRLREPDTSEDLHFLLRGPVVSELQHVFDEDWALATGALLPGDDRYYPDLEPEADIWCRAVVSGPDEDERTISRIMQAATATAQSDIRIVTPYFLPPEALISHLIMASLRRVRVQIMLPAQLDHPVVGWAAETYFPLLRRYNVDIRLRPAPFMHAKLMVVDGRWTYFGSANIDPRSLRLNFELNVEAWSESFAFRMAQWFDQRFSGAAPVVIPSDGTGATLRRLRAGVAQLLSPML